MDIIVMDPCVVNVLAAPIATPVLLKLMDAFVATAAMDTAENVVMFMVTFI